MSFINHVLHMTSQYLCISTCISMMLLNILFLDDIFCFETSVTSSKLVLEKGFPPISLTSKEKYIFSLREPSEEKIIHTEMLALLSGCHLSHSVYRIQLGTALCACLVVDNLRISVPSARRYPRFPAAATGPTHRITWLSDTSRRWIEMCTSKMSDCRWMPKCGGRSTTDTTPQRRFNQSSIHVYSKTRLRYNELMLIAKCFALP